MDLGSNSFHMVVARAHEHDLEFLDKHREMVRLAGGLDARRRLDSDAIDRGLACLERFGQRLKELPEARVRVVGTNTLRKAKNARRFLKKARRVLGHEIEVISGNEEARLIYLGVAHDQPDVGRRLVVDIGGGSTEVMVGEGFEMVVGHSLYMGCVSFSQQFFAQGELTAEAFQDAEAAARLELRSVVPSLDGLDWVEAVGASGTLNAVAEILQANGWGDGSITATGLKLLRKELIRAGTLKELNLAGLRADRVPVIAGGVAVLRGVFKSLGVETMGVSSGALREGVLWDLLGRIRHEDVRDRTIGRLIEQYRVDVAQAERVQETALALLEQISTDEEQEEPARLLRWASQLHEIGLAVAYTGYQRHGSYILAHTWMPGFSSNEQLRLAAVVRGHRRKLPPDLWEEFAEDDDEGQFLRLCIVLRLAVLLNRGRTAVPTPRLVVKDEGYRWKLRFAAGWLDEHQLTRVDLENERRYLRGADIDLVASADEP